MKCADCVFHYKDENDRFACCHYVPYTPWDVAPCEYGYGVDDSAPDEDYYDDIYDEVDYKAVEKEDPITGEIYWELEEAK